MIEQRCAPKVLFANRLTSASDEDLRTFYATVDSIKSDTIDNITVEWADEREDTIPAAHVNFLPGHVVTRYERTTSVPVRIEEQKPNGFWVVWFRGLCGREREEMIQRGDNKNFDESFVALLEQFGAQKAQEAQDQ